MRDLGRRCAILTLVALFAVPGAVLLGQEAAGAGQGKILDDQFYFVREFDRGWDALYGRVREHVRACPDDEGPGELFAEFLLAWGDSLLRLGDENGAYARFKEVCEPGSSAPGYGRAAGACGRIEESFYAAAGSEEEKLRHVDLAIQWYSAANDSSALDRLRGIRVDLLAAEGLRAFREKRYAYAYKALASLGQDLGESEAARALAFLETKTAEIRVDWIEVRSEGTDMAAAELVLTPAGPGSRYTAKLAEDLRWETGRYQLTLVPPGAKAPLFEQPLDLAARPFTIRVPRKIPTGMVFVAAEGGRPAFFIDRTEVTVGEYGRVVPGYRPANPGDDLPAHGISFADARAYAAKVGKKLPTFEQWTRAAVGGSGGPFPWGASPKPSADRCVMGVSKPSPVGRYPAGASPCGALDMLGNVWEWLDDSFEGFDGWAIGGGFRTAYASYESKGWNVMQDRKPDQSVYDRHKNQRKYQIYYITQATLVEVGFRCVIEL